MYFFASSKFIDPGILETRSGDFGWEVPVRTKPGVTASIEEPIWCMVPGAVELVYLLKPSLLEITCNLQHESVSTTKKLLTIALSCVLWP